MLRPLLRLAGVYRRHPGRLSDRGRPGLGHAALHAAGASGSDRAAERAKALMELRAAETEALTTPAWLDQGKGIVRLPIEEAMRIVVQRLGQEPGGGPVESDRPRREGHGSAAEGAGEAERIRVGQEPNERRAISSPRPSGHPG